MKVRLLRLAPLVILAACVGLWLVSWGTPASGQGDTAPSQLRVVWTQDPAHRAVVSWSTREAGQSHVVLYDTAPRGDNLAAYAFRHAADISGRYTSDGPSYHHAQLADLQPDTAYHFVVVSDGVASEPFWFRTAPDDDTPFRLLYGGDSRTDREDRQRMNRFISRLHDEDPSILALVHGGDYIEDGSDWSQWHAWLDDHHLSFGSSGRILPIVPARGNHESDDRIFNRVFAFPGGDASKNYFVTRFSDRLVLINLDSEASQAGDQRDWLEAQLASAQDARFVVVNYHRPAYPAVKSPGGARRHWVPLFERYDVDLVCESDGHVLKRTAPIRNEEIDWTGVVYVGEGGLGVRQRTPDLSRWYLQGPGMATSAHHIQILEPAAEVLRYQAVLPDGELADERTILPRAERVAGSLAPTTIAWLDDDRIELHFTRELDPRTAADPGNYTLSPAVDIVSADVSPQADRVTLQTAAALDTQHTHLLTLSNLRDAEGNTIAKGTSIALLGGLVSRDEALAAQAALGCSATGSPASSGAALVLLFLVAIGRRRLG